MAAEILVVLLVGIVILLSGLGMRAVFAAGGGAEGILWIWTAGEVVVLVLLLWGLSGSVFWETGFLASVSRPVRVAGLVFVVVQLLIPAWVFADLYRYHDEPNFMWVHVSAMPLLNVFGLIAYLEERRRREDRE